MKTTIDNERFRLEIGPNGKPWIQYRDDDCQWWYIVGLAAGAGHENKVVRAQDLPSNLPFPMEKSGGAYHLQEMPLRSEIATANRGSALDRFLVALGVGYALLVAVVTVLCLRGGVSK